MKPAPLLNPSFRNLFCISAGILSLAGCSDAGTHLTQPQKPAPVASIQQSAVPRIKHTRYDTPWRTMSDDELSAQVTAANGRVFIGLKEAADPGGVDALGRVLVRPTTSASAKSQLRGLGLQFTIEYTLIPAVVARIPETLVAELRRNPLIDYIEPIFPGERLGQDTTWNVRRVNAPSSWAYSTGSGAKLLIIDSGIKNGHPDLAPAVIQSCESPPSNGLDQDGHGTMVAGVAAAVDNTIDYIGVSHGAALWSSKDGDAIPDPSYTACGVQFGRVNGVQAINISTNYGSPYTALTDQVNGAYYQNGIVVVAAAGNSGTSGVGYPARLGSVIAVSATNSNNNLASFSSYGPEIELTAPGDWVYTTCFWYEVCPVSGTSFSSPHVAAAAALLKAYSPSWSALDVRYRLALGATDLGSAGRDTYFGYGLLNIAGAIQAQAPQALSAGINGPNSVKPSATCLWTASASGGLAPYSYVWMVNDVPVDNGSPYPEELIYKNSGSGFTVSVNVFDGVGASASRSKSVTVSASAPNCVY